MVNIDETLEKIYTRKFESEQGMENFVSEVTDNDLDKLEQLKSEVETYRQNKKAEFEVRKQLDCLREPQGKGLKVHFGEPWSEKKTKRTRRSFEIIDGLAYLRKLIKIIDDKIHVVKNGPVLTESEKIDMWIQKETPNSPNKDTYKRVFEIINQHPNPNMNDYSAADLLEYVHEKYSPDISDEMLRRRIPNFVRDLPL